MIRNSDIDESTITYEPVNIYDSKIGKNCVVGMFTEISSAIIGDRCKIGAHAFIPKGVTIEDEVLISPHVCLTNDKYPRAVNPNGSLKQPEDWKVVKTLIKSGASLGANSTIMCGVTVGRNSMIGAGAVLTHDAEPYGIYVGNPAKKIGDVRHK